MKAILLLVFVIIYKLKVIVFCNDIGTEDGILILTTSNFYQVVSENKFVLVEFYTEWCSHCIAFAPEYIKIVKIINERNLPYKVAKVDGAEERILAEKHQIIGYPTIKLFYKGTSIGYKGVRTANAIINWMNKKAGNFAFNLKTIQEAEALIDEHDLVIIGFFKNYLSKEVKMLLDVSESLEEHVFAITSEENIFKNFDVKENSISLFNKIYREHIVFEGEFEEDQIMEFIMSESLPLVSDYSQETMQRALSVGIKDFLFLFLSIEIGEYETYMEEIKNAAKHFRGKVHFIHFNTDLLNNEHLLVLNVLRVKVGEMPTLRFYRLNERPEIYKPKNKLPSEENIKEFVVECLKGLIERDRLSQDMYEDWSKHPVKTLVANNFEQIVFDKGKDVLVNFYSSWCQHCKDLTSIFDKLAEKYSNSDTIMIAKVDVTANEIDNLDINKFPTIKLYRKEDNVVVEYSDSFTLNNIIKFIDKNDGTVKSTPVDETKPNSSKNEL